MEAVRSAGSKDLWIAGQRGLIKDLLDALVCLPRRLYGILLLERPKISLAPIRAFFDTVLDAESYRFLPTDEMLEALTAANRTDLLIGGSADPASRTLTLIRGDLKPLVVPFSMFPRTVKGVKPDFARFALLDHGQTVKLGAYEASTDAIL